MDKEKDTVEFRLRKSPNGQLNWDKPGDGLRLDKLVISEASVQNMKVVLTRKQMLAISAGSTNKSVKIDVKSDLKGATILNLKMDKKNVSYKYKKVQSVNKIITWLTVITGSIIGSAVGLAAINLSMVISLF